MKLRALPGEQPAIQRAGKVIRSDGVWKVYEFTWQMDVILFWARVEGRWLRGTPVSFSRAAREPAGLKPLENWPKSNPRDLP
ncbi:hypothetical protein QA633_07800 [Bradyrhizobium barranii]|uniref:hypothetical protein n=1 Tax=Bradyrhizobium barranii TaxID=2992140 RepID=UPI0024B0CE9E|nr:hypothetical protein [Bradyrhizobium barranii]WFT96953.1 hypothetical protein QA633_07800 [Bradyrhizobium barranii]